MEDVQRKGQKTRSGVAIFRLFIVYSWLHTSLPQMQIFRRLTFLLILAVASFGGTFAVYAQRGPSILRQKTFGGSRQDYSVQFLSTADSGFLVLGYTNSTDKDFAGAGYHPGNGGPWDISVMKLTKAWDIQWKKAYGGGLNDGGSSIAPGHNGGYIICGYTQSSDGDATGVHGVSPDMDMWVVKITNTGVIEWQKSYGGSAMDNGFHVTPTYDGGYLLSGWTGSTNGDVTSNHGSMDMWLIKINSTGTIVWQKTYGGSLSDSPSQVFQTQDSGYVVFGQTYSTDGDVLSNHGGSDVWVLKLNQSGTIQWQKSLGGPRDESPLVTVQTFDGGYAFVGGTNSMGGDVTYWRGGLGQDIWCVKLSDVGTIQWEKSFGGTSNDLPYSLLQEPDSSFIIGGITASLDGTVDFFHHGAQDAWILKLTKTGTLVWQQTYGGSRDDWAGKIITTNDGYIFLATTASNDKDVSGVHDTGSYQGDMWMVELCQTTGQHLSASSADFGGVPLCTFKDTLIEITDTGCFSLFIDSVKITGQDYALLKRPKNKILWDGTDTVLVRYQPISHGLSTGAVTIYYNERYTQKTLVIPLSGVGAPGMISLTSSLDSFSYTFPPTSLCSRKDTQYVTLKNLGCDTIKIVGVSFIDDGTTLIGSRVGPLPKQLYDDDTLWCRWIITPSITGTFQAKIIVTLKFPDGTTRDTILTANAVVLPGSAKLSNSLNKAQYDFTARPACTKRDSVRFAIRNLGCDTLEIINVNFSNDGITLSGVGPTGGKLIGNQELSYYWRIDPQQPGVYAASVTITFKLPDGTMHDTTFSATATVSAGAPIFSSSLQSAMHTFPSRSLCAGNDTAHVVIRNGGCDTLEIVNVQFTNASEITGKVEVLDATLAGADSALLSWVFDPSIQGTYTANITITYRLPEGTEHDTTITATATVLPGDALFVSSLQDPAFTFASLPACGDSDSIEFAIKNPGCDTLSIVNVSFTNHAGILEGSQDAALTSLIADDSIVFRWRATASTPGTYLASITVTYKLPDGSQHDTIFSASFTVTPGEKSILQSLTSVDFGQAFLCQTDDTTIVITNSGCDTLTVFSALLGNPAFTFTATPPLPRLLLPKDSIRFTVSLGMPDTSGHPLTVTDLLTVESSADIGTMQIPLNSEIIYPVRCGIAISPPMIARNMQRVTYKLSMTGTPPKQTSAMYFDLVYDADLLEFIPTLPVGLTLVSTVVQGENMVASFAMNRVPPASTFADVSFLAFLAETDTTTIRIENVRFDVDDGLDGSCIATVDLGSTSFTYLDLCGESTIRSFLQGNSPFNVIAIRPQPAANMEKVVYLDIDMHEAGEIAVSYRDVLGASGSLRTQTLQKGRQTVTLDIRDLHEGVHLITVESGGRTEIRKLIVQ